MRSRTLSFLFLVTLLSFQLCAAQQSVPHPPTNKELLDAAKQAIADADKAEAEAKAAKLKAELAKEYAENRLKDEEAKDIADAEKSTAEDDARAAAMDDLLPKLHPTFAEHLGRSLGATAAFAEQPSQVTVNSVLVNNPQGFLSKGSLTFTSSEFFLNPAAISTEYQAFSGGGGRLKIGDDIPEGKGICSSNQPFFIAECLVRIRKRDLWYRALSGFTGTLSYSENLRAKSDAILTAGSAAASKNNQWSGSVVFSPSAILLNGTDWQNAQSAAALWEGTRKTTYAEGNNAETTVTRELLRLMIEQCDSKKSSNAAALYDGKGVKLENLVTAQCVKRLGGASGARAWVASLLPDVTYQVQTQFDFISNGGTYLPYAGLQSSLWTVSASWNLSKYLPSAANRVAALNALVAAYKQNKEDEKKLKSVLDSRP